MKLAKGYFGSRKNVWTVAKNAVEKALTYAYVGRKHKKRNLITLDCAYQRRGSSVWDVLFRVHGKDSQKRNRAQPEGSR